MNLSLFFFLEKNDIIYIHSDGPKVDQLFTFSKSFCYLRADVVGIYDHLSLTVGSKVVRPRSSTSMHCD